MGRHEVNLGSGCRALLSCCDSFAALKTLVIGPVLLMPLQARTCSLLMLYSLPSPGMSRSDAAAALFPTQKKRRGGVGNKGERELCLSCCDSKKKSALFIDYLKFRQAGYSRLGANRHTTASTNGWTCSYEILRCKCDGRKKQITVV